MDSRNHQALCAKLGWALRDLLDIADEIRPKGVVLTGGRTTYSPGEPVGAMLFQALGMPAEFEVAKNRERARRGVARAKANKYRGRKPKLSPADAETSTAA